MSPANPRPQDPSMEEILASIRRIIADDQDRIAPERPGDGLVRARLSPRLPDPAPRLNRAEATPPSRSEPVAAGPAVPIRNGVETGATLEPIAPVEPPGDSQPAQPPKPSSQPPPLLSEEAGAVVARAFDRLAASVPPAPARSLEEHLTDLMRPMLRAWLDENLPALVERLVQAEIERRTRSG